MYLTRMAVNGARRGARKLLMSPHAMHAAVLAGFPPGGAGEEDAGERVLWRVDHGRNQAIWLLVASPERPDLSHLIEQAGWPTAGTWETRDYRPLLERVAPGQHWMFRLTANPVHTVTDESGQKRRGHVTAAQQQQWLLDRAGLHGFVVADTVGGDPDLLVTRREKKSFRRRDSTVTLSTAQFDGRLEVVDPVALRRALVSGIGRGKGYGCGMITLAPSAAHG